MGNEAAPMPQPTPEELNARLMAEHADAQIEFHGRTMALSQFVQLRKALCPVQPGAVDAAEDTAFLVNVLTDSKVELDESYHSYIRTPDVAAQSEKPAKVEAATKLDKKAEVTAEVTAQTAVTAKKQIAETQPAVESQPATPVQEQLSPTVAPAAHAEVFAKIVQLEESKAIEAPQIIKLAPVEVATTTLEPAVLEREAAPSESIPAEVTAETETNETPIAEQVSAVSESITEPVAQSPAEYLIADDISETVIELRDVTLAEPAVSIESPPVEIAAGTYDFSALNLETVLPEDTEPNQSDFAAAVVDSSAETITAKDEMVSSLESVEIEIMAEKSPAVMVAEFMVQALPAQAVAAYEKIQTMEPEAAAEVAARVELLVIVSDRMHELVVTGRADGEEGHEITAYLKREYEAVLRSVGIEPTAELIEDYITYVFSQEYQTKASPELYEETEQDDGMHEKKLFDEQSVFAKAQQATRLFGRRFGLRLGKLAVNSPSN